MSPMNILRKSTLFLVGLLLTIALPVNTLFWTTRQTVMNRDTIIGWMKEGKVYENIADTAAKIAEDSLSNKKDASLNPDGKPLNDDTGSMPNTATLIRAAKVALPPNVLEADVDIILNSAYDWIEGKTDTIVLNLDLSDEKTAFVNALGDEAISRAASLPTCTAPLDTDFDPLSSSCIPSGVNVGSQVEKIKNDLSASADFLPDTLITSTDITVGDANNKKLLSEEFSVAPKIYKQAKNSAYLSAGVVAMLGLFVFLLGKTRRSSLKINAWLFGLAGSWALLLGMALKLSDNFVVDAMINKDGSTVLSSSFAAPLISQITSTLLKWHMVIGGAYLGVAIICIVAARSMNKKDRSVDEANVSAVLKSSKLDKPKPAAKPRDDITTTRKPQQTKIPNRQNLIQ